MQQYWVIQSTRSQLYYEQDFAGWSWVKNQRDAYQFPDKERARFRCEQLELPLDYLRRIGG